MRLRTVVALTAASLVLAWTAAACAAPDAPTPRELFDDASASFARGDVERALNLFRRAFERAPHDAVRFNIARCLERLRRFAEARREYELAAASPSLDAKARGEARGKADALTRELGTLVVVGSPAGADVLVNERATCKLPCREMLDPGIYRVTVRSGEATSSASVTLGADRTFELRLEVAAPAKPPNAPPTLPSSSGRAGWLTWTGGAVALVGTAGIVGFGLQAEMLHARYLAEPTADTRDTGLTMRALTNGSIAVAIAGGVAAGADLLFVRSGRSTFTAWHPGVFVF